MSRKRAGWTRLNTARSERDKSTDQPPGEGGHQTQKDEQRKSFVKRKLRKAGVPQEGGHSQASIGEQENLLHQGGHSQSSNGINPHREKIDEGGHNQASSGKQLHYGHHGRYNDTIDM